MFAALSLLLLFRGALLMSLAKANSRRWSIFGHGTSATLAVVAWLFGALGASGAPPAAATLLPDTTLAYLSVASLPALRSAWDQTQLARLCRDPAFEPFGAELRAKLETRWAEADQQLGLRLADLEGLAAGEICVAVVPTAAGMPTLILALDTTGRDEQRQKILAQVEQELVRKKAKKSAPKVSGLAAQVFDLAPRTPGEKRQIAWLVHHGLLVLTEGSASLAQVAARLAKPQPGTLAESERFRATGALALGAASQAEQHVRWFVDPVALMRAEQLEDRQQKQPKRGKTDVVKLLTKSGLDGIQALGGYVQFKAESYELVHRTALYAPGPRGKGMRMFDFPVAGPAAPPDWVTADLATCVRFQWNVQEAFEGFGHVFEAFIGEDGAWGELIDSVRNDPNGPQIDLRKDLVMKLAQKALVLTDSVEPVTPTSERMVLAVETVDPQGLAAVVHQSMKGDPTARLVKIAGHDVWMILSEEDAALAAEQGDEAAANAGGDGEVVVGNDAVVVADAAVQVGANAGAPRSGIAVVFGHLMVASDITFFEKLLVPPAQKLSADAEFLRVDAELVKLGCNAASARMFSRLSVEYRPTYELLRTGKLGESTTPLAQVVRSVLGDPQDQAKRARVDGSKLPDYEVVRPYLGAAGAYAVSGPEGIVIVGAILPPVAPLAAADVAAQTGGSAR